MNETVAIETIVDINSWIMKPFAMESFVPKVDVEDVKGQGEKVAPPPLPPKKKLKPNKQQNTIKKKRKS